MAHVAESTASLRITGDDLDPNEISRLLACEPTQGEKRGDRIVGPKTGHIRIAKCGMWRLAAERHEPENIDAQVEELLLKLNSDLSVWDRLARKYSIEIFSGLFMNEANEGFQLSANTVRALGERGIELQFDIYGATREPNAAT
jgi:hypothetical protein